MPVWPRIPVPGAAVEPPAHSESIPSSPGERSKPDLFDTPPWVDEGLRVLEDLIRLRAKRLFLEEQRRRVAEELRTTSQRVNLFEKVKIPETRENIRVIRIFLGDLQAAEVARAKIAKKKTGHQVEAA